MPTPAPNRAPRRRWSRLALAVGALAVGCIALELGLRALLFVDVPGLGALAERARRPARFADPRSDERYWALRHRLGLGAAATAEFPDARLGWVSVDVAPSGAGYGHALESNDDPRTPVLLFGDSFAQCATPGEDCFQGLLDRAPEGGRFRLLNFGVGGYGLDQIALLARGALDHRAVRPDLPEPVVVVALLVDDDLNRCALAFRDFPKPRFVLEGGALRLEPPETLDAAEWLDRHPTPPGSWLARWLLHDSWLARTEFARRRTGREERVRPLARALLADLEADLAARGLEHFYLLFPGHAALQRASFEWEEPFLEATLAELGARFVNARRDFEADRAATGRSVGDYFLLAGPGYGHYDAGGNAVALRALLRGLAGEDDAGR